ncbi:hypothetical protein MNBD_PLANCTO02-26 [hydrothermal vent metagenome]|uniref:Pyrrolo-quinoline quinone repeat domain-containing protein n=1 Tax=hydrothermal vent metagenome TaxID=652676 RepID=A0A3B1E2W5_9ZZZZ
MNKFVLGCFTLLLLISVSLPLYGQRSLRTVLPKSRELSRYGLERHWWSQATLNPRRDTVSHFQTDEDLVYVQSTAGLLTVLNAETGRKQWAIQLGFTDRPSYPVTSNQKLVLVASGMELYAFYKWSGKIAWKIHLPKHPSTRPTMDDENVYIGTLDGSVYAFRLRTIHKLYDENRLPQWSHLTMLWRYKTPKEITTPPISDGLVVSFASMSGSLYSVNAYNRKLKFQMETNKPISAPMSQSGKYLFMASEDYVLYCINMRNGQSRWEFVSGYRVRKEPWLIEKDVYLTPVQGGLFRLSIETGKQKWRQAKATDFLCATPQRVYASDAQGNMLILNRKNGGVIGSLPYRGFSKRINNNRTDRLFLATPSGLIVCIKEKQIEYPFYYKFPEHRPILPSLAPEEEKAKEEEDE